VLAPLLIAAAPPADDTLEDACGTTPSWLCETAWNVTERSTLTRAIDWAVARPLAALLVLVVAAIVVRWLQHLVTVLVTRAATGETAAALDRLSGANRVLDPRQQSRAQTVAVVARAVVAALVWTVAVLTVLSMFDLDLAPLLASAGIAAVAVGFGAQSLVKDCIAGFFVLLEDQFGVGDEIEVGAVSGTVESLTLRMTQVRGQNGTLWSIPNGTILAVGNRSRNWSKGFLDVMVRNDTDLDRAVEVVAAAVHAAAESEELSARFVETPEVLGVDRVGVDGTAIRIAIKTLPGEHVLVMRAMRLSIKRRLDEDGIAHHPAGPEAPGLT
jgi:small-conductance mechanosensitive channel